MDVRLLMVRCNLALLFPYSLRTHEGHVTCSPGLAFCKQFCNKCETFVPNSFCIVEKSNLAAGLNSHLICGLTGRANVPVEIENIKFVIKINFGGKVF